MDVEWDAAKATKDLQKHRVSFADAATALHDEHALTIVEPIRGEQRFVSLGMDALGRLLVVVFTYRQGNVRLISARRATKTEARQYAATRKP